MVVCFFYHPIVIESTEQTGGTQPSESKKLATPTKIFRSMVFSTFISRAVVILKWVITQMKMIRIWISLSAFIYIHLHMTPFWGSRFFMGSTFSKLSYNTQPIKVSAITTWTFCIIGFYQAVSLAKLAHKIISWVLTDSYSVGNMFPGSWRSDFCHEQIKYIQKDKKD